MDAKDVTARVVDTGVSLGALLQFGTWGLVAVVLLVLVRSFLKALPDITPLVKVFLDDRDRRAERAERRQQHDGQGPGSSAAIGSAVPVPPSPELEPPPSGPPRAHVSRPRPRPGR